MSATATLPRSSSAPPSTTTNSNPKSASDSESTPTPQPIAIQHRNVTLAHQKKLSLLSKRILACVLSQIGFEDTELAPYYQVRVTDLTEYTTLDASNAYKYARAAIRELRDTCWDFEDLTDSVYVPRHLLNTTLPRNKTSRVEKGVITIVFNPELAPYFVNLAGPYTSFKVLEYLELKSWFSMRFFEILSNFRDTGWWEVSLDDYRRYMDCAPELDKLGKTRLDKKGQPRMKYAKTGDLIISTILVAQTELAQSELAFKFQKITVRPDSNVGPPRVVGFRFELERPLVTAIPAEWLENPRSQHLIEQLRKFQVTDKNIIKYWPILTPSGTAKLLRTWQLKQNSNKRIENLVSYCNAAFCREGLRLLELRQKAVLENGTLSQTDIFGGQLASAELED